MLFTHRIHAPPTTLCCHTQCSSIHLCVHSLYASHTVTRLINKSSTPTPLSEKPLRKTLASPHNGTGSPPAQQHARYYGSRPRSQTRRDTTVQAFGSRRCTRPQDRPVCFSRQGRRSGTSTPYLSIRRAGERVRSLSLRA